MHILFQNARIHYRSQGKGAALVLLHGFTESQSIWDEFATTLSASFQLVTIDLPGHGQSDSLGSVHTMEQMAGSVKAVLDHMAVSRCVMVGHSMGAYVGLAFARKHPEMLAGFGLFHSTAAADSDIARAGRDKAIAAVRQNHKDFLIQFIPSLFAPANRKTHHQLIDKLVKEAKKIPVEAIVAAQEGMKVRADHRDLLRHALFPVLFITGKQDIRIPTENILPQIALPRRSYSLILDDVGHMGWAEAQLATLNMIASFTKGCYLPA